MVRMPLTPPDDRPLPVERVASRLDAGLAFRAAIGLLVLASDQTIEHEFGLLVREPGVRLYSTRIYNDNDITTESLNAVRDRIAPGVSLLLPGVGLDVVAFGCTSATMALTEAVVMGEIRRARPDVACTTPVTAVLAACAALEVSRIALITPYAPSIAEDMATYLAANGLEVICNASFDRVDDREAARISEASVADAIRHVAKSRGVEAVFVSCTSLRVAVLVAALEAELGIPITSSNHALAWHARQLAGLREPVVSAGRLYSVRAA